MRVTKCENIKMSLISNKVVKVNKLRNPAIKSEKEWVIENEDHVPPFWSEDYAYIAQIQYRKYLQSIQKRVEEHQQEILLTDPKLENNTLLKKISVKLQTSYFKSSVHLILRESNGDEIEVSSLSDLHIYDANNPHFTDRKVQLVTDDNTICITKGQRLYLHIIGGILLIDNIFVSSQYHQL